MKGTIKKSNFKTNYNSSINKGYHSLMPSKTVQGETLTIQEIFQKSADISGFEIHAPEGTYLDVEDIEDIDQMYRQGHDLTDIQRHAETINKLNEKVQKQLKEKQKSEGILAKEAEKQAIIKAHNDELNDEKAKKEQNT